MRNRAKSVYVPHTEADEMDVNAFDTDEETDIFDSKLSEKRKTNGWPHDDERTLIENIKSQSLAPTERKYTTQIQKIDWNSVKFGVHSASECERHFKDLMRSVRTYRILPEIIKDIEVELAKNPFKRPPSGYNLYIKDKKENLSETSKSYRKLPAKEKKKYEDVALKLREEYSDRMKEFYKNNPKTAELKLWSSVKGMKKSKGIQTPFKLFSNYCALTGRKLTKAQFRAEYNQLEHDEKYAWVMKSVEFNPGIDQSKFLNKEERRIYLGQLKPAPSAYSLFLKFVYPEYKGNGKDTIENLIAISARWKATDATEKKKFQIAANKIKESCALATESFARKHDIPVVPKAKGSNLRKQPISRATVVHSESEESSSESPRSERKMAKDEDRNESSDSHQPATESLESTIKSPIKTVLSRSPHKTPQKSTMTPRKSLRQQPTEKMSSDEELPSQVREYIEELEKQTNGPTSHAAFLHSGSEKSSLESPRKKSKRAKNEDNGESSDSQQPTTESLESAIKSPIKTVLSRSPHKTPQKSTVTPRKSPRKQPTEKMSSDEELPSQVREYIGELEKQTNGPTSHAAFLHSGSEKSSLESPRKKSKRAKNEDNGESSDSQQPATETLESTIKSPTKIPIKTAQSRSPLKMPQKSPVTSRKRKQPTEKKSDDDELPSQVRDYIGELEKQTNGPTSPNKSPNKKSADKPDQFNNETNDLIDNFMEELEQQLIAPSSSENSPEKSPRLESTASNELNSVGMDEADAKCLSPARDDDLKKQTQDDSHITFLPPINSTKHQLDFASPQTPSMLLQGGTPLKSILKRKQAFHAENNVPESQTPKKLTRQISNDTNSTDTTVGIEKLKFDNYTFVVKKAISATKIKWKCSRMEKYLCKASITTELIDGAHTVTKEGDSHNHPLKQKKA